MTRRVLVTGSRGWTNYGAVDTALTVQLRATEDRALIIVHGDAQGADRLARKWASHRWTWAEVKEERHPARWEEYCCDTCEEHRKTRKDGTTWCPRQGFLRNEEMVKLGADLCLAFPQMHSKGTWSTMLLCEEYGIPVKNLGLSEVPDWFRKRTLRRRAEYT